MAKKTTTLKLTCLTVQTAVGASNARFVDKVPSAEAGKPTQPETVVTINSKTKLDYEPGKQYSFTISE